MFFHSKSLLPLPVLNHHHSIILFQEKLSTRELCAVLFVVCCLSCHVSCVLFAMCCVSVYSASCVVCCMQSFESFSFSAVDFDIDVDFVWLRMELMTASLPTLTCTGPI